MCLHSFSLRPFVLQNSIPYARISFFFFFFLFFLAVQHLNAQIFFFSLRILLFTWKSDTYLIAQCLPSSWTIFFFIICKSIVYGCKSRQRAPSASSPPPPPAPPPAPAGRFVASVLGGVVHVFGVSEPVSFLVVVAARLAGEARFRVADRWSPAVCRGRRWWCRRFVHRRC